MSRQKRKGFMRQFFDSFGDPVIRILIIALAINIIFLSNHSSWFESLGIAGAILMATFVSTLSEYGSEKAFEKLQEESARIRCRAFRGEYLTEIPISQVVVGDFIKLQAGDKIPADGILISGSIDVDQSALNGESEEIKKSPGTGDPRAGDLLSLSAIFSGTTVCAGEGVMRVTLVGDNTFYGKIGLEVQKESGESPMKQRLASLAKTIGRIGYAAAAVTVVAYFLNTIFLDPVRTPAEMLNTLGDFSTLLNHIFKIGTLAVTVIVMAVPEGLPMMITVVLSANMRRMLKDQVLVRKLVGIETAGSLNILFTDKTGTLTQGSLQVSEFISGDGKAFEPKDGSDIPLELRKILYESIAYNTASEIGGKNEVIGGNATDRAVLKFISGLRNVKNLNENLTGKKIDSIPFDSSRKYMSTVIRLPSGEERTFFKGAPEKILSYCKYYYNEKGECLPISNRSALSAANGNATKRAVRLLAVAVYDGAAESPDYKDLKLVGILGLRDKIRPEAKTSIKHLQKAGIQTVMLTGDAKDTAEAIAKETGLISSDKDIVITSTELRGFSDDRLKEILPRLRVVARTLPEDKSRLVMVAQSLGLVVGMTGDGVNDAPALKNADVGFAMGSGTEVAKEAGDIVILNDSLISIEKAVRYGRTIFKSIRKFIIYQLSICMCAVGVTVLGPLLGIDSPITVIQMLWINMVMDTLAGLAFSGEKAQAKYMEEPPKRRDEPMMNGYMKSQVAVCCVYVTALCLFFLKSETLQGYLHIYDNDYLMTAFFALFMFVAIFMSFCARTHKINLTSYLAANKPFLLIMALVTVIQILILYFGDSVFRTVNLAPGDMLKIALLAMTIIPVDLLRKLFMRRLSKQGT